MVSLRLILCSPLRRCCATKVSSINLLNSTARDSTTCHSLIGLPYQTWLLSMEPPWVTFPSMPKHYATCVSLAAQQKSLHAQRLICEHRASFARRTRLIPNSLMFSSSISTPLFPPLLAPNAHRIVCQCLN